MTRIKKNIYIVVAIFLIASCASDSLSGNKREEELLFEQVKHGMTAEKVKMILGEPDEIIVNTVVSTGSPYKEYYHYYFKKNKSPLRSHLPTIVRRETRAAGSSRRRGASDRTPWRAGCGRSRRQRRSARD